MRSLKSSRTTGLFLVGCFVATTLGLSRTTLASDDWPQILGPQRNGIAKGETLLDSWPKTGPRKIWSHTIGEGYAGPAVSKDCVIVFHRVKSELVVESLSRKDGKPKWSKRFPASYGGGIDSDRGPRCVPLIHDGKIFLFSAGGKLLSLNFDDGKLNWSRELFSDYSVPPGYFGAGSTPIVTDNKLIVNVGSDDAAVVAFDLETGKTIWTAGKDRASYSSPIAFELNQRTIVAVISRLKLLLIEPQKGNIVASVPFGKRGPTVNGANPVFADGNLFINSAYNVGARLYSLKMESGSQNVKLEPVWQNDRSFSSQYSTPVFFQGHYYGTAGREDFSNGSFRCVEAKTGKVKWQLKMPVGHTLLVGDKLLTLDSTGNLHLHAATSEAAKKIVSAKLFDGKSRAIPALSNGQLFARSNGARAEIVCFEVGKRSE